MQSRRRSESYLLLVMAALAAASVGAQEPRNDDGLETVVVTAQRQAFRGDVKLEDLPQSVQVISAELLATVGVTKLDQVIDLASGVARQNTFGGLWDSFAIRGFAGDENTPSGYLVNGFNSGRGFAGRRDSSNIERVEVLKGPGSALYGRSEPGGTINIVTKKPQFTPAGSFELSGGSFSTYRVGADITGPLGDKVAVRVNGAYEDSDSFRDNFSSERLMVTPSILFRIGERASLSYELEWNQQEAPFDRGVVATAEGRLGIVPNSRFLGEPGDGNSEVKATGHQLVYQFDFTPNWSLLAGLGYRDSSFEGFSSDPELVAGRQPFYQASPTTRNILLSRQRRFRDFNAEDMSGRVELSGSAELGSITHHLLGGIDTYDYDLDQIQNRFRPTLANPYGISVLNPVYGQTQTPGPFVSTLENQKATGFYLQDQMDLTDQWKFLLGVRFDDYKQVLTDRRTNIVTRQSKSETSPRVGLVYQPSDQLSLYASYSKGFRPNSGQNFAGVAFSPETSKSAELGVKLQNADGRITGTIAIYQAKKTNFLTADPVNAGFSLAAGEAESKGLEVDFSGKLTETLSLTAAYAYTDAEVSKPILDFNFGFTLPAGSPLINIPKNAANLLLMNRFTLANEQTLDAGFRVNYVSDRAGETGVPIFVLPSYTLMDLLATYAPTEKLKISAQITNVLDKTCYPSSYARVWVAPGAPRAYTLKLQYQFK